MPLHGRSICKDKICKKRSTDESTSTLLPETRMHNDENNRPKETSNMDWIKNSAMPTGSY